MKTNKQTSSFKIKNLVAQCYNLFLVRSRFKVLPILVTIKFILLKKKLIFKINIFYVYGVLFILDIYISILLFDILSIFP